MSSPELIPDPVQPRDTVAVVSPSAPGVGRWPRRVARATSYLDSLGLAVRIMPHAAGVAGWVSASPQQRAQDIHEAFADSDVSAVIAAIGGNHSNELLPHLDFDLIRANPKLFQGYSDITVLHWAIRKHTGLRTYYGPNFVMELAEYPAVLPFTDEYLRAAWAGDRLSWRPAKEWTDERLDYDTGEDESRARRLAPGEGWTCLRGGTAEGPLLGGCLETIAWHLKGSAHWLDLEGAILFLETSEVAPSPADVASYLTDFAQIGVFDQVAGLIVARPARYAVDQVQDLWEVVRRSTEASDLPVMAGLDFGHADPQFTIPLGAHARLDCDARTLELKD